MIAKYILEQRILGPRSQVDLTEERYNELAHAREVLSGALVFEQRYELVLSNFISMELMFTEFSLRTLIEPLSKYPELAESVRQANRHIVNFLTAMRGYYEQVQQDFKCLELEHPFKLMAKAALTKLFERSSDYRFLYELRDHVQHKATAVHGFEPGDATRADPNGWAETVKFLVNKASLRADKDFKVRVLDEQPEKIDIRRCARQSMQEIGVTHLELRKATEEHVARARSAFERAISDYNESGADSTFALCARRVGDADADVLVHLDWDDVRMQLLRKNHRPPRLMPRRTYREPKVEEIVALRREAQHSKAQAAAAVFVSEERWHDYEDGLPMPEGLFRLYQLQVGRHPTHSLQPSDTANEQMPDSIVPL